MILTFPCFTANAGKDCPTCPRSPRFIGRCTAIIINQMTTKILINLFELRNLCVDFQVSPMRFRNDSTTESVIFHLG
ncbi:hypothetical protein SUGI_0508400 [Cryptomeria japonica]|nr:hypothetical protein SUGI_0508400 [Cryptomeria japonica]